jgi:hypothetical protein
VCVVVVLYEPNHLYSVPPTTPGNGGVKGGSQCGVCVTAPSQSTETVCPFHDLPTDRCLVE